MEQLAVAESTIAHPHVAPDQAAAFERELPLVEGAVTLVASGTTPRVTLVGLSGGLGLARLATALGRRAGVVVLARDHGPGSFDLIVEQDG
jgi:hypothetical protein